MCVNMIIPTPAYDILPYLTHTQSSWSSKANIINTLPCSRSLLLIVFLWFLSRVLHLTPFICVCVFRPSAGCRWKRSFASRRGNESERRRGRVKSNESGSGNRRCRERKSESERRKESWRLKKSEAETSRRSRLWRNAT